MTPNDNPTTRAWDSSQRLSQARELFQRAWKEGRKPAIEKYLEGAEAPERAELLWELLSLELDLRDAAGDRADLAEYQQRFPQDGMLVEALFSARGPGLPAQFGRYRVLQRLGGGGFGNVYLCFDDRAERQVAVKVPRPDRLSSSEARAVFLREARHVARLDHPHIVPLYDIGDEEGQCYLVYKFIPGESLFERIQEGLLPPAAAATILAQAADALHHAHVRNLFHRDIKPANILLDPEERAHVIDFGLGILEEDLPGDRGQRLGTYPYMSPEQVRGEGHRIDGRTDIYSLGVVLYELLTGRRPFTGSIAELCEKIVSQEIRPPRQIRDAIPRELERICLKATAKQMTARYATAADLADDLRHYLAELPGQEGVARVAELRTAIALGQPPPSSSRPPPSPLVPKGLRSFGPEDRDFFLELLPGPRDREGLPDSIRFWKVRSESCDPDQAFAVGLLYGPSGCGKSSLVKAGLLPRLAEPVASVYVEATAQDTETQLARKLRQKCPALGPELSLAEMLAHLRRGRDLPDHSKVLIVLDQFEQWLHAHGSDMETSALVAALRHADGRHVQVLLLVRDDFWMGTSRLFDVLEINLDREHNARAVDLFDAQHARRVLTLFGQAFERLPVRARDLTRDQEQFLERAVAELSQDGRVIPVRLSLFADLMKDRPWTATSLQEMGGAEGVGLRFLEETFTARTALPDLRASEQAVRALLAELLPDRGTDIKGRMRSRQELALACGWDPKSPRLARLLEILDRELHILTPTEVESSTPGEEPGGRVPTAAYYQLTHDYLVPPLRQWLTRERRRTWRGRAELCLEERTAEWTRSPQRRFLPSAREYLTIALAVPRMRRTPAQAALLRAAGRLHLRRWAIAGAAALAVALAVGAYQYLSTRRANQAMNQQRAAAEVHSLLSAAPENVATAIERLRPYRELAMPSLRPCLRDPTTPFRDRLHAALALAALGGLDPDGEQFLVEAVSRAPAAEGRNLLSALETVRDRVLPSLRQRTSDTRSPKSAWVRYAITLLYLGDPAPARESLQLTARPDRRTAFIHAFKDWRGDLRPVARWLGKERDSACCSGLCAALGQIPSATLEDEERQAAGAALLHLYQDAADGGTHSAAGWALRQWQLRDPSDGASTPRESPGVKPPGWFVNLHGMTMVRIRAAHFFMGEQHFHPALPAVAAVAAAGSGSAAAPLLTITLEGSRVVETMHGNVAHPVELTHPFYICDREVTVRQFRAFVAARGLQGEGAGTVAWGPGNYGTDSPGDWPAQYVSWFDAVRFCVWLSEQEHLEPCYVRMPDGWRWLRDRKGYRLPTEAEWEYACRAGTVTKFFFGDDASLAPSYAVCNFEKHPKPVASLLPNPWGLFDVHGNVLQWCWDWEGTYPQNLVRDPQGPARGTHRILRAGYSLLTADMCTSAARYPLAPSQRPPFAGLRVVYQGSPQQPP